MKVGTAYWEDVNAEGRKQWRKLRKRALGRQ
jgi:hypothetical protein